MVAKRVKTGDGNKDEYVIWLGTVLGRNYS